MDSVLGAEGMEAVRWNWGLFDSVGNADWTPWVHHLLFTVYHFSQPHNYLTIYVGILPMVWIAWRKQNLYLSLAAHLLLNLLGAVAMLGVAGGVE